MEQVEWGEYKLWDEKIFEIWTGSLVDIKTASEWKIPRVSVQTTNNWILWYYDETLENARYFENFISINFFWIAYYHPYRASVEMKVHTLKLVNHELTKWEWLFMTGMLNKRFIWKYSYGSQLSSSKLKNENFKIQLPTKNWEIDFEFMEMFIKELESYHIKELESYLQVTWLKDYNLTEKEKIVLSDFENGKIKWREFKIGWDEWLFEKVKVSSLWYKTSELPKAPVDKYCLSALTAWIQNQWLNNYIPKENATILKNVISISANWANTWATFYQNKEFTILQDAYAIEWKNKEKILLDNMFLFFVSLIAKAIYWNYEWTNKAWWEKVKKEKIQVPIKNWEIDFNFMETFISAIQKLVIKDVVDYANEKIKAYHKVIW